MKAFVSSFSALRRARVGLGVQASTCACTRGAQVPTAHMGRIAGRVPPRQPTPHEKKEEDFWEWVLPNRLRENPVASNAYARVKARLVGDTIFIGVLYCCLVWSLGSVDDAMAALLGCGAGLSYVLFIRRDLSRQGGGIPKEPLNYALLLGLGIFLTNSYGLEYLLPGFAGYLSYNIASVAQHEEL